MTLCMKSESKQDSICHGPVQWASTGDFGTYSKCVNSGADHGFLERGFICIKG